MKDAMIDEMQALKNYGARELTDPQEGKQKIGCQWLLALKHNPIIQRYKTRMVAKGPTKACSIDHPGFFFSSCKAEFSKTVSFRSGYFFMVFAFVK